MAPGIRNQPSNNDEIRRGVYDSDYFSGAQTALYIGDVWVDEVTSIEFNVAEPRVPLYGYADTKFVDVCRGQVLISGTFTINFKEAGYLWLILNRFKQMQGKNTPLLTNIYDEETGARSELIRRTNIEEQYVQDAIKLKNKKSKDMANFKALASQQAHLLSQKILTGYASSARGLGAKSTEMSGAENTFEAYEDLIWGQGIETLPAGVDSSHRRAMDINLNPFDIYITYGDYTGDNRLHHTVQMLRDVYIVSSGKRVTIDGSPIQEYYQFIAKDLI